MVNEAVKTWFMERAGKLAQELTDVVGKPVTVTVCDCPGSDDGLHLKVEGDKMAYEAHVWEEGISDFDIEFFESQFAALKEYLRLTRLGQGFGIIVTVVPQYPHFLNPLTEAMLHPEAIWN